MKHLINLMMLSLCVAPVLAQAHAASQSEDSTAKPDASELVRDTRDVVLLIEGMRTNACPVLVKAALSKLEGIERFAADVEKKTVAIRYDQARVSVEEIQNAIKLEAGFDSKVVSG